MSLAAWLLAGLAACSATFAHADPEAGWWWNPQESGRGYFLEIQGPRIFLAGYFYAADGRATWLVSNDPMPAENFYSGRLLAFKAGQSLVGDYRHPDAPTDAGAVTLSFSDTTHAILTWPGGTVAIERYRFASGEDSDAPPMTGWWWNPDESGRGMSIEVQGEHMFIGSYMYDMNGNPLWYVADALMQSPTVFQGPLLQFANGQTMAGAYHAPGAAHNAGTLRVEFTDADHASVTLSDTPGLSGDTLPKGMSRSSPHVPQRKLIAAMALPEFFKGKFTQVVTYPGNVNDLELVVTATSVRWDETELTPLNGTREYEPRGEVAATMTGVLHYNDGGSCGLVASGTHTLVPGEGHITLSPEGIFTGWIRFLITIGGTCDFQFLTSIGIPVNGTSRNALEGTPQATTQFLKTVGSYRFCRLGVCPTP